MIHLFKKLVDSIPPQSRGPENQFFTTYDETARWLDKQQIKKYTILDDLSVDVGGRVELNDRDLHYLPVKFNRVVGFFDCSHNILTSLKGSPLEVFGDFDCSKNQLKSLQFCPELIHHHFLCFDNSIESLEFFPQLVKHKMWMSGNPNLEKFRDTHEFDIFQAEHLRQRIEREQQVLEQCVAVDIAADTTPRSKRSLKI